jgi:hypothetical protein
MLSSLCPVMAAIPPVSRFWAPFRGAWGPLRGRLSPAARGREENRRRFTLGFGAASWQHRILDCGTLILYERCAGGT